MQHADMAAAQAVLQWLHLRYLPDAESTILQQVCCSYLAARGAPLFPRSRLVPQATVWCGLFRLRQAGHGNLCRVSHGLSRSMTPHVPLRLAVLAPLLQSGTPEQANDTLHVCGCMSY